MSTADASQLTAAGFGFVADANDVSGNNNPNGGGTYVGTSTTVAGATTTHIADANTVTSGNVDGNEHATANPVDGLTNNGFGVTLPAPAAPAGGTGNTGGGGFVLAADRAGADRIGNVTWCQMSIVGFHHARGGVAHVAGDDHQRHSVHHRKRCPSMPQRVKVDRWRDLRA